HSIIGVSRFVYPQDNFVLRFAFLLVTSYYIKNYIQSKPNYILFTYLHAGVGKNPKKPLAAGVFPLARHW
ncbi:MAG: hypothetical protein J6Q16_03535, partial [Clostridia bacterium]|nr:hypothetical protein [Clostridia bacterium]